MVPSPMTGSFQPVERIVVPVQGTDREFVAQQWAVELAAALGISVFALHVDPGNDEEMHDDHFAYLRSACEKWGVEMGSHVTNASDVVEELLNELAPRDLVVLGTRHLGGHYHMGSVAAGLVRRAPCPVQMVRLEGA